MGNHENERQIVNIDDPNWTGTDEDGSRWKRLGQLAGGTLLGCTLEEIQPNGRPAHYHYHLANEEALYVIKGEGTLVTPGGETVIKSGDYVAFPVGKSGTHAVENTSNNLLRCLFFSTMRAPDVAVYPDDEELYVGAIDATFPFDESCSESDG